MRALRWAPLALVVFAFAGGVLAFAVARRPARNWTIDDAAITFAYAQNLARGHGFALEPGGPRVEGFSNPLQLALCTVAAALGLFHPMRFHRFVEPIEFGLLLALVLALLKRHGTTLPALAGTAVFGAAQLLTPAVLIWYGSGLENVQVSLVLVLLLWRLDRVMEGKPSVALDTPLVLLAALVRPEGIIYPAVCALVLWLARARRAKADRAPAAPWWPTVAVSAAALVALELLRVVIFGSWLPNTFFAKAGNAPLGARALYVVAQVLPYGGAALLFSALALWPRERREQVFWTALVGFAVASLALPLVGGADWMGEHRFATPFFTCAHLLLAFGLARLLSRSERPYVPLARAGFAVASGAALLYLVGQRGHYREFFARASIATLENVADVEGFVRLQLQHRLGLPCAAVALPDAGGSHLVGAFRSIDTFFLTDYQMARIRGHRQEVRRYQRDEQQVDLIQIWNGLGAVDPTLLGTEYVPWLRFPNPYKNWDVVYWVRRELLEPGGLPEGAQSLGRLGPMQVWLSPRALPVVVAGGLVRVELLVQNADAPSDARRLRLRLAGDEEEITPEPEWQVGEQSAAPGRIRRVAFLLHAPRTAGRAPLLLEGVGPQMAGTLEAGTVAVLATPAECAAAATDLAAWREGTLWGRAFLLGQLREQAVVRLPRAERRELLHRYRNDVRAQRDDAKAAFDALLRDATASRASGALPEVRSIEQAMRAQIYHAAEEAWAREPEKPLALLRVGRWADRLRRLGLAEERPTRAGTFAHLARQGHALVHGLSAPLDRYRALVGLVATEPWDMDAQARLLEARSRLGAKDALWPTGAEDEGR